MPIVENWQPTFVGEGRIRYYSLARYALIDALRLAGVRTGTRVLLPEFICRDLLAPLHLLGAVPCWYSVAVDLSPATLDADWPLADVVLVVNYFGFAQCLEPFRQYAVRTGAILIEDNAHGYLSRDLDGQWLGCRTDLGIFSLRKTLRIPDGGALWVGDTYAEQVLPKQLKFDGGGINSAQLTKARLRSLPIFGESAYRLSTTLVRAFRKWRSGISSPETDPTSEQIVPALANPWAGLMRSLVLLETSEEIQRRRSAYLGCVALGKQLGASAIFADLPQKCVPYAYAFRGDQKVFKGMRNHTEQHGFDMVSWPDLPAEIVIRAPAHYQNIFLVNLLW